MEEKSTGNVPAPECGCPVCGCPVCGNAWYRSGICQICGYDETTDYEKYPTLGPVAEDTTGLSVQRKNYEDNRENAVIEKQITSMRSCMTQMEEQFLRMKENASLVQNSILQMQEHFANMQTRMTEFDQQILQTKKDLESLEARKRRADRGEPEWVSDLRVLLNNGSREISFGRYPQNDENTPEPIQWQVLDRGENGVLLLSKYILDSKPYNAKKRDDVIWENCDLRRWLDEDFRKKAFTEEEQQYIKQVKNENNVAGRDGGGKVTEDQIFLLDRRETERYLPSDSERLCKGTGSAKKHGLYVWDNNGCSVWWLRSVGSSGGRAMRVSSRGGFRGYTVDSESVGVRPALWLNLES